MVVSALCLCSPLTPAPPTLLNIAAALTESVEGPPNDDVADGSVLVGDAGSVGGSNVDATAESGEVDGSCRPDTQINSVWWSWTPSQSGSAQIDTNESGFDTTLAVYTGDTIAPW